MDAYMFMFIMIALFAVVGVILYNICKYTDSAVVSKVTIILIIVDVFVGVAFGFGFPGWFEDHKTKGEEIERYEIIDASLTTTKYESRYAVSFADGAGNISVTNVLYQEYTDEDSYIALHRFHVGFLYDEHYVYYIHKESEGSTKK